MTESSTKRPLIVLSVEGLARSSLGCYGCSWNQTPAIDTIASTGVVWDRLIAESDDPAELLRSWLESNWLSAWESMGSLELVTDSADDLTGNAFDHVTRVSSGSCPELPANDIVDTQLGQLIAAAVERDQTAESWSVMWIHTNSLMRCWDAPRELFPQEQLDDEEDLEPPELDLADNFDASNESTETRLERLFDTTVPPDLACGPDDHPDWVAAWMRTYGCQVRLLDVLIEVLLQSLDVTDPWFVLVGTSGYRLGQSGWIGSRGDSIRSSDIHLPFLVSDLGPLRVPRLSGSRCVPEMLQALAEERPDVPIEGFDVQRNDDIRIETQSSRVRRAITTHQWFYVQNRDESEHLFLKPDDIEDFNDVARVREEIVEDFRES
ncbi:MAG: hypothetical protein AAGI63_05265 [Planctomycetota bacterium]